MKIAENTVVAFNYVLKNEKGEILDTSFGNGAPLEYLHGAQNIIPGLEKELSGLEAGDKKSVKVVPEEGYGIRKPELEISIPKTSIEFSGEITPGMRFHAEDANGAIHAFTVKEVTPDGNVKLDGNHALAGETLFFDVEIVSVRNASDREIADRKPFSAGCDCGCGSGGCCDGNGGCGGNCDCEDDDGFGCGCGCDNIR